MVGARPPVRRHIVAEERQRRPELRAQWVWDDGRGGQIAEAIERLRQSEYVGWVQIRSSPTLQQQISVSRRHNVHGSARQQLANACEVRLRREVWIDFGSHVEEYVVGARRVVGVLV